MPVLLVALSYLLGSISFSSLFVALIAKANIRDIGSGNAGATNTSRILGLKWAVLVLILDIAKGMAPIFLSRWLFPGVDWLQFLCGLSVVVGHNWPIYYKFRGGKGVATSIGVLSVMAFIPALAACIICIVTIIFTRYVSLGSLAFICLTPVFTLFLPHTWASLCLGISLALVVVYRHRENIVRLLHGSESKFALRSTRPHKP
ncbi:glycerol-3-phosphate 1-O-acyltransferase PlsY [Alicyclobacillus sp. ALC3]|uniref:glycerol-3-phosphate 1-O-acyltransferase PlsY n=1 Tax=Alicyclobacillus sp. ALC3 TaxID=2796143 RepID=UPI002378945A|nr:glycerol-3-phosphate 1-O-acyltransferase PlsY [Alicyclobacillus sp. ALC3]WDL98191.1 glycerol-3-phosphate 1-O-acyltransferase PlsY [Alicyclobacillus sp. ALC3]